MDNETIERFYNAVQRQEFSVIKAMLREHGALATSVDGSGQQPIHAIGPNFDEELLNLLLANGADINARDEDGFTVLHLIHDPEAVPLLVGNGADLEARDGRGRTPLVAQAENYEQGDDIVVALLELGANPHAKSDAGETALMFARQSANHDLTQRLLVLGATD